MASHVVTILIILSVVLIGLLMVRPSLTAARGGKILAFIALFILPITALALGLAVHLEDAKSTEFCLSCHTMEPYGKSLRVDDPTYVPAAHFQNNRIPRSAACYTCHHNYTMFGGVKSKLGVARVPLRFRRLIGPDAGAAKWWNVLQLHRRV